MEHKIIMLGGRRAGKSTILSSILKALDKKTSGDEFVIKDKTDYTQMIETKNGMVSLPSLSDKYREVSSYMMKTKNEEFLVDMSPTYGKSSYCLDLTETKKNSCLRLEFVDVPGEWMEQNKPEYNKLKDIVGESDVFVIAIDTPYLMCAEDESSVNVNDVYNRVEEITKVLDNMRINSSLDLKKVILCPVKCEKWVGNNEVDKVVERVKEVYKNLINGLVPHPEINIQIMPIQTVGGLEFSRMLPALLYFKDDNEKMGVVCSRDPKTKLLVASDGRKIRESEGSRVENDTRNTVNYTDIPRSWYKVNGKGFQPVLCEQPGYHILKFIVEKEENVNKAKADADRQKLDNMHPIVRFFKQLFNPTFGHYLPVWREVIDSLSKSGKIKTDGDGFCYLKSIIK